MTDYPSEYTVGYRKPPLHSRFRKGQSGNPQGGRRHRRLDKRLATLLETALDARVARPRRPKTQREAIVATLVEKSAAGDIQALKLLLLLLAEQTGLDSEPFDEREVESARARLIASLDRLAAEYQAMQTAAQPSRDDPACG